jgi:hypothetical protein
MNCHSMIKPTSPALSQIRESWDRDATMSEKKTPMTWRRVHRVPDFAFFNHAVHVKTGLSCTKCHGPIEQMDTVRHDQSLTMKWCLDCHRHPPEAETAARAGPQSCQSCHR